MAKSVLSQLPQVRSSSRQSQSGLERVECCLIFEFVTKAIPHDSLL